MKSVHLHRPRLTSLPTPQVHLGGRSRKGGPVAVLWSVDIRSWGQQKKNTPFPSPLPRYQVCFRLKKNLFSKGTSSSTPPEPLDAMGPEGGGTE